MTERDLGIRWELANYAGILVDGGADAWHSGHVTDVLEVDEGAAGHLVATETGGVWSVPTEGTAFPLSNDWNSPDVNCLAAGPDGPRHFYAGTDGVDRQAGVIYGTDVTAGIPLLAWQPLTPALPAGAGDVKRLLVMPRIRRIIAVCRGGIWWSQIPAVGSGGSYVWAQAKEIGLYGSGWYDGALGSTSSRGAQAELDADHVTVVAGRWTEGIAVGQFEEGDLVMRPATVLNEDGFDDTRWWFAGLSTTSIAGCWDAAYRMLAAAAKPDGTLMAVFRSSDGGRHWTICGDDVRGSEVGLRDSVGCQGNGWNNCVAIHPGVPNVFALGWQNGTFLSFDGGAIWLPVDSPHLHDDVHVLRFVSAREDEYELLVGSDGGLAVVSADDILADVHPPRARSDDNRNLPALQCLATLLTHGLYGTLGVGHMPDDGTGEPGDVIVSGLQDNSDAAFQLTPGPGPWLELAGADGGWSGVMSDGGLVYTITAMDSPATVAAAQASRHIPGMAGFINTGVITNGAANENPAGLADIRADTVRRPSHQNAAGGTMQAVAAARANADTKQADGLYGLFVDPSTPMSYHWERLADLPAGVDVDAVASDTGATVFIGCSDSRIVAVGTATGSWIEMPVQLPQPFPGAVRSGGGITRIVALPDGTAYAALNMVTFSAPAGVQPAPPPVTTSYVLRFDGSAWQPTAWAPFGALTQADTYVYGLEVVLRPQREPVIFAASDALVYGSPDQGRTWFRTTTGLPARPHNTELRHLPDRGRRLGRLYLSTYGRSVWSASMNDLTE